MEKKLCVHCNGLWFYVVNDVNCKNENSTATYPILESRLRFLSSHIKKDKQAESDAVPELIDAEDGPEQVSISMR